MIDLRPDQQARLRRALRYLDDQAPLSPDLPKEAEADSGERRRRMRPIAIGVGAFLVTLSAIAPIAFLSGNRTQPAGGSESPTTDKVTSTSLSGTTTTVGPTSTMRPSTTPSSASTPEIASEAPVVASITEIETDPSYQRFDPENHVAEVLETTGVQYESFPDFIPDAAVAQGRAVIVGGNEERIAGIWYSDGGAWNPPEVNLPAGMRIGESDGDYRLVDGIMNVETDGDQFVAWEYVQIVQGTEPASAGTLIFTSADGMTWTAILTAEQIGGLIPWGQGYIGTYEYWPDAPDGPRSWLLGWSTDLTSWTELANLGEDYAFAIEGTSEGALIRQESGEDGEVKTTSVEIEQP